MTKPRSAPSRALAPLLHPRTRITAFILYALALVTLTHYPQLQLPPGPVPRPDLVAHLGAFGLLAALLMGSTLVGQPHRLRAPTRTLLITLPYAVIDEATQAIPGLNRFVSPDDLYANWAGLILGTTAAFTLANILHKLQQRQTSNPQPKPASAEADEQAGGGRGGFVGDARTFALITIVSRIFGLARDALCAAVFGASPTWSAFVTAFIIPNILRRLFGEGSLAAAFLPAYTKLDKDHPQDAQRLALVTLLATAAATTLIALALLTAGLIALNTIDDTRTSTRLVITLTLYMLPFMPTICLTALLGSMLQTHNRFAPGAAAPIVMNACMISAITLAAHILNATPETTAAFLAAAVAIAGIAQTLWCLTELSDIVSWRHAIPNAWQRSAPHFKRMLKKLLPVLLGLGTLQLGLLIDTLIAGWPVLVGPTIAGTDYPLDTSAAAVLYFAQRLYHLPIGVFAIALATAIFPALAKLHDNQRDFTHTLRMGIRVSLFVGAPAALGLAAVAAPLTQTIYGTGTNPDATFTSQDAQRVTTVTIAYATAIAFVALTHTLTRAFYAKDNTRTPMKVAIASVTLNVALNLSLIWSLEELGLAVASAIAAAAHATTLLVLARTKLTTPDHPLLDKDTITSALRSITTAAAMAALVHFTIRFLSQTNGDTPSLAAQLTAEGRPASAFTLACAVVAGGGGYALASRNRPELKLIVKRNRPPSQ